MEAISSVAEEIASLSVRHFDEIAIGSEYGYHPDWGQYLSYELADKCVVVTARYVGRSTSKTSRVVNAKGNGTMIGYAIWLIGPFKHNKNIQYADLDAIWISPVFRSGFLAMKILKLGEEQLKGKAAFIMATSSKKYPIDPLFLRRGYEEIETVYWKVIDDGS